MGSGCSTNFTFREVITLHKVFKEETCDYVRDAFDILTTMRDQYTNVIISRIPRPDYCGEVAILAVESPAPHSNVMLVVVTGVLLMLCTAGMWAVSRRMRRFPSGDEEPLLISNLS